MMDATRKDDFTALPKSTQLGSTGQQIRWGAMHLRFAVEQLSLLGDRALSAELRAQLDAVEAIERRFLERQKESGR